ncbi:hypothetical protein FDP41_000443 [Naegleria fowleri]|uniref:Pseudouridine synthase RsuA/RluA-like domain-containing protein n=1 Tax=Naegleria fowleri TaxID=5763 RepID=A0A6A5CDA6_NAEFO|nr:uncharacterized protein FDP41_000443 [Naegleria fowleri]KAF0984544.1 hypothetical protein FDP41_000443 [Naegleria fowleri]CAG4711597.1 unnamed protein product [Naegleria fowleri]
MSHSTHKRPTPSSENELQSTLEMTVHDAESSKASCSSCYKKVKTSLSEEDEASQSTSQPSISSYIGRNEILQRIENNSYKIPYIYKDVDVIVIDKPYDLHIDGNYTLTVEKLVNTQYPEMENPPVENITKPKRGFTPSKRKLKFCHQLDYATSGILCLAFTRSSCANISQCFQQRTAKKKYLAVVRGHIESESSFDVTSWIEEDPSDENKFKMRNYYKGLEKTPVGELKTDEEIKAASNSKESFTHAQVLKKGFYHVGGSQKLESDTPSETLKIPVTKVLLTPSTGRRHQLRLHMQLYGTPILGDGTYGHNEEGIHRMMLHAWSLSLPGVLEKELVTTDPFEDANYFEWE